MHCKQQTPQEATLPSTHTTTTTDTQLQRMHVANNTRLRRLRLVASRGRRTRGPRIGQRAPTAVEDPTARTSASSQTAAAERSDARNEATGTASRWLRMWLSRTSFTAPPETVPAASRDQHPGKPDRTRAMAYPARRPQRPPPKHRLHSLSDTHEPNERCTRERHTRNAHGQCTARTDGEVDLVSGRGSEAEQGLQGACECVCVRVKHGAALVRTRSGVGRGPV